MKWSPVFRILFAALPSTSAMALESPLDQLKSPQPIFSCVAASYAIRIFPADSPGNQRVEIRGSNLSLTNIPVRYLVPNRDRLHFPSGTPKFECASISPDGSDYRETIRVYDTFVHVLKSEPGGFFTPVQYEIQ
jgi:hypothetical protein